MKNSKKKAKILFSTLILIIIIFLFVFFVIYKSVNAEDETAVISKKSISATIRGEKQIFTIEKLQENDNSIKTRLIYQTSPMSKLSVDLVGFEDGVLPCKTSEGYLGDEYRDILCLTGDVGVHSQNLSMIRVLDNKLEPVYFKNGADKLVNITSDVPNIQIKDYNNDGKNELVVGSRDYDNDPTINSIQNVYVLKDGVFESTKEILY